MQCDKNSSQNCIKIKVQKKSQPTVFKRNKKVMLLQNQLFREEKKFNQDRSSSFYQ